MKKNKLLVISLIGSLLLPASSWARQDKEIDLETFVPYNHAVDVFNANDGNPYKSIRIPSIINANGLLIAAAEGRYWPADQADNDIIVSVSKDNGKTWSKLSVAASDPDAAFNNPYLIYDRDAKRSLLFFQRYPKGVAERSGIAPGWKDKKSLRNLVCFSTNGKKWTRVKDVTSTTKHEDATITCSGPNPGVQLSQGEHKGRLVVVFNEAVKFGDWVLTAAFSDDGGKTWQLGEKSESGKGINEVSVAETDDGGLYVVSRAWGGGGRRVAYSHDGGQTWSPIETNNDLPSPGCQNGMARYSHADDDSRGGKSRIIFASPVGGRKDAVIKMSYDNGQTWPVSREFGAGPYAYSAICPLEPGFFGVLFETNDGRTIRFVRIPVAWLTWGDDTGKAQGDEKKEKSGKGAKS